MPDLVAWTSSGGSAILTSCFPTLSPEKRRAEGYFSGAFSSPTTTSSFVLSCPESTHPLSAAVASGKRSK